ncbi:MAG TPA: lipase family protein [Candidatus Saccharimonadales bacterium]|nr:lipase family protein [Candidatus Saccharimonadales bacterium]
MPQSKKPATPRGRKTAKERAHAKKELHKKRVRFAFLAGFVALIFAAGIIIYHISHESKAAKTVAVQTKRKTTSPTTNKPIIPPTPGTIDQIISTQTYPASTVTTLASQDYGKTVPASTHNVTQVLFTYYSQDTQNKPIVVYARAYIPQTSTAAPILGMAPGTTGIGDECAASLENVAISNWGNYESVMMAYASQGFAGVITDYEGMRDPSRIHHYMVGVLEGRAVLDSIKAFEKLPQAVGHLNTSQVFLAGYSQGGHSAFWADTLAASYAPSIKISGLVVWAPVLNVEQTLQGILSGSTLDWFGPYVLVSYSDYYHTNYNISNILLPKWSSNLDANVLGNCVGTAISFWGTNPAAVYTPQFISDLRSGTLPSSRYGSLQDDMAQNVTGDEPTATPKLIEQGETDNVVLASQAKDALPGICAASKGPVTLTLYPQNNHYTIMHSSFTNSISWMNGIDNGTVSTAPSCNTVGGS